MIAAMLGLGEDQVRAIAPEVGGGFGAKINIYAEEYVTAAVSKQLGVPVKWIEDRSEAFVATTHGRDILGYIDLAAKRDGTVLGLKMRLIADIGAYNMLLTAAIPTLTMLMANAHLRHPGHPHDADRGVHQQDADRRLPRRRPPRGDLLRRARDRHAGARAEHGSGRGPAEELHPKPTSSRSRRRWARSTTRATTRQALDAALEAADWAALKARARRRPRRGPARRARPGDVRRGLRHRAVGVAARPAAGSTRRSRSSATAGSARPPAPRRTARATRRPSRRCSPTSSACRSSTSRFTTATPRW